MSGGTNVLDSDDDYDDGEEEDDDDDDSTSSWRLLAGKRSGGLCSASPRWSFPSFVKIIIMIMMTMMVIMIVFMNTTWWSLWSCSWRQRDGHHNQNYKVIIVPPMARQGNLMWTPCIAFSFSVWDDHFSLRQRVSESWQEGDDRGGSVSN